jgi:NO-binding membrane sensor protein with MHYT domain
MSKLDAMAIKAIVYVKPRIVTINQIRLSWEAMDPIASYAVLKVEFIKVTQDRQRQQWLIGGVTAIGIRIWAMDLFVRLLNAINDPAQLFRLRSDSLCC